MANSANFTYTAPLPDKERPIIDGLSGIRMGGY